MLVKVVEIDKSRLHHCADWLVLRLLIEVTSNKNWFVSVVLLKELNNALGLHDPFVHERNLSLQMSLAEHELLATLAN